MFKKNNRYIQPMKQLINNINQIRNNRKKNKLLNKYLAYNIKIIIKIDLIKDIKVIKQITPELFLSKIIISLRKKALKKTNIRKDSQVI